MTIKELEILEELNPVQKKDELLEIKNDKAYIDNILVNAIYKNNNLTAFKILFYLARIQSKVVKKGRYYSIEVVVNDLLKYTNIKSKQTIERNLTSIQQNVISFRDRNGKIESSVQLITNIQYLSTKKILIDMHDTIYDKIKYTDIEHTVIDTINVMKIMKNKHSIRMIMLLQYIIKFTVETKYKKYTLKQLNALFGTKYSEFYEIERKILKSVQKELDNNSNITFKYEKIEDLDYIGQGRKPIKEIKIIPINTKYIETDIFSNFEEPQTKIKVQPKDQEQWKLTQEQIDDLMVKFGVAQSGNQELMNEFEAYLYEQQEVFKQFCNDNNKQYKNMNESFKRHLKNAEAMKIDFFAKLH